jgi:hypothetical protein
MFRKLNYSGGTPREISEVVNNIMDGKTNNTGEFSTTALATTTTLYDERIGYNSAIFLTPMEANSAAQLATLWIGARSKGSVVINHAANAYACSFMYVVVG